ncbi:hypothetical protein HGRIS_010190 [Hohenbuehelia grisea]|uniref:WD40 repeat-like protein n=1 Tax=Hohenbuehelia grisea TaxID=104357 RepID=A0ABR3J3X1_9AGAR
MTAVKQEIIDLDDYKIEIDLSEDIVIDLTGDDEEIQVVSARPTTFRPAGLPPTNAVSGPSRTTSVPQAAPLQPNRKWEIAPVHTTTFRPAGISRPNAVAGPSRTTSTPQAALLQPNEKLEEVPAPSARTTTFRPAGILRRSNAVAGPSPSISTPQAALSQPNRESLFTPNPLVRSSSGPSSSLGSTIGRRWDSRGRSQTLRDESYPSGSAPAPVQVDDPMDVDFPNEPDEIKPVITPLAVRKRRSPSPDADSDYDNYHAGFNVYDDSIWNTPLLSKDEIDAPLCAPQGSYETLPPRKIYKPRRRSVLRKQRWRGGQGSAVWAKLAKIDPWSRSAASWGYNAQRNTHRLLYTDKMVVKRYAGVNDQASGSVNKILQSNGLIIACSAALGGSPDGDNDPVNLNDNKLGSTIAIRDGHFYQLDGHIRHRPEGYQGLDGNKHYTVNDIAADPTQSVAFVSSGNDQQVITWKATDDEDVPSGLICYSKIACDAIPHVVAFQPSSSVLAVSCANGNVYVFGDLEDPDEVVTLNVAPEEVHDHMTGATVWGYGESQNFLFASSESHNDDARSYHRAFDVHRQTIAYEFDAKENGDSIAIDPTGSELSLITQHASDGTTFLRMYDIRRRNNSAKESIRLPHISPHRPVTDSPGAGEVNCAVYSPDGVFLAIAQNDDSTLVYDSRFLGRGPIYDFRHQYEAGTHTPGDPSYGVVHAEWTLMGSRLGLVTGGDDGCVRHWSTNLAASDPSQGKVLARADRDVGHFTLGKLPNEKPLVVGDNGGQFLVLEDPLDLN